MPKSPKIERKVLVRRIIAGVLDYALYIALVIAYVRYFGEKLAPEDVPYAVTRGRENLTVYHLPGCYHLLILAAIWLLMFPLLEGTVGQTIAKGMLGLCVRTVDGSSATLVEGIQRRLLDPIDILLSFGIVGLSAIAASEKNQRLGDRWAKTVVVSCPEIAAHPE